MHATFTMLDYVFFTFTFIFVLTAFLRGFIKEIFSLLNWIVALTLSYFLTPFAVEFLSKHFESKLAVDIAARSIIFLAVFIIIAISTSGLCESLREKTPKAFDRSLGVLYGFLKTLLIFGFIYALYFNLYGYLMGKKVEDDEKSPAWLKDAQSHSLIKISGEALDPLVKAFFESITKNFDHIMPKHEKFDKTIDEAIDEKTEEAAEKTIEDAVKKIEKNSAIEKTPTIEKKSDNAKKALQDSGYNKKDIEKMNRLIDIIDK